jgi:hypothetical protein
MLLKSKSSIAGRTSIVALSFVAVTVVAGCLLLMRKAPAQITGAPAPDVNFGPVGMTNYGNLGVGNLTVKSFLPGAPNPKTPFRVEAFTNYATVSLAVPASPQGIDEMEIFFADDVNGKLRLWVEDLATGDYNGSAPIGTQPDAMFVAARIHPAVRGDGTLAYPLAAAESADVNAEETNEDGYEEWYTYTFELEPAPVGGLGG